MNRLRSYKRIVLLGMVFVLASLLACDILPGGEAAKPTVVINSPPSGTRLQVGQEVTVQSMATDPKGVTRVELWVDGTLFRSDHSPQGQPTFSVTQTWVPNVLGSHTLAVKAYNAAGRVSDPAVITVEAVEVAVLATPTLQPPLETPTLQPALELPTPWIETLGTPTATLTPSVTVPPPPTPTPPPPPLTGKIAFAIHSPGRMTYETYVTNVDGSGRAKIADEASQPSFSPDGTQIAYRSWKSDERGLMVANADGSNRFRITRFLEDADPAWASDSKRIVFGSNRHGDRRWRIYHIWANGEGEDVLHKAGRLEVFGSYPFWLSDGRIVYQGCDDQMTCGIVIIGGEEGTPKAITTETADTAPAAYDGKIAFMSKRDGNWEVYLVNADGSDLKRLTDNPANDGLPTWSPDGGTIAFVSDRQGGWAVWAMSPDGGNQRKLFDLGGSPSGEVDHQYRDWTMERIT